MSIIGKSQADKKQLANKKLLLDKLNYNQGLANARLTPLVPYGQDVAQFNNIEPMYNKVDNGLGYEGGLANSVPQMNSKLNLSLPQV